MKIGKLSQKASSFWAGRVIFGGNDANLPYHALAKKIVAKCEEIVKPQESQN